MFVVVGEGLKTVGKCTVGNGIVVLPVVGVGSPCRGFWAKLVVMTATSEKRVKSAFIMRVLAVE